MPTKFTLTTFSQASDSFSLRIPALLQTMFIWPNVSFVFLKESNRKITQTLLQLFIFPGTTSLASDPCGSSPRLFFSSQVCHLITLLFVRSLSCHFVHPPSLSGGSPLEASGPLAYSMKMPKQIHWWSMSSLGEWQRHQGSTGTTKSTTIYSHTWMLYFIKLGWNFQTIHRHVFKLLLKDLNNVLNIWTSGYIETVTLNMLFQLPFIWNFDVTSQEIKITFPEPYCLFNLSSSW